jgi:immune inhibitor A
VDAHPTLMIGPDNGNVWRPRHQSYDSTFGLDATDKICLTASDTFQACYGPQAAVPLFNDMLDWWVPPNPAINHFGWSGVNVPKTGTDDPRGQHVGARHLHAGARQQVTRRR